MVIVVTKMTIWFYVKTNDDPKAVGDIVCAFNFTEGTHPGDKYSWIMEVGKDEPGYWEIKGKFEHLKRPNRNRHCLQDRRHGSFVRN